MDDLNRRNSPEEGRAIVDECDSISVYPPVPMFSRASARDLDTGFRCDCEEFLSTFCVRTFTMALSCSTVWTATKDDRVQWELAEYSMPSKPVPL